MYNCAVVLTLHLELEKLPKNELLERHNLLFAKYVEARTRLMLVRDADAFQRQFRTQTTHRIHDDDRHLLATSFGGYSQYQSPHVETISSTSPMTRASLPPHFPSVTTPTSSPAAPRQPFVFLSPKSSPDSRPFSVSAPPLFESRPGSPGTQLDGESALTREIAELRRSQQALQDFVMSTLQKHSLLSGEQAAKEPSHDGTDEPCRDALDQLGPSSIRNNMSARDTVVDISTTLNRSHPHLRREMHNMMSQEEPTVISVVHRQETRSLQEAPTRRRSRTSELKL